MSTFYEVKIDQQNHINIPKSSVAVLKSIAIGSSMVVLEPLTRRNAPGSYSQTFATRLGIKISTTKCLILTTKDETLIPAVIITRLS